MIILRYEDRTSSYLTCKFTQEKELRRVFEKLVDYQARTHCKNNISELEMGIKLMRNQAHGEHTPVTLELQEKVNVLKKELEDIESKPERLISCNDVYEMLKTLRQTTSMKTVQEMVWEVDEDLDGHLNWSEFRLMFNRNIMDSTGLEPSRMFNLVQFMIYDRNENNRVSVDETMKMLYARYSIYDYSDSIIIGSLCLFIYRYGKDRMEVKLKELFGVSMQETGREGGDISFSEFTAAVEGVQLQTFWKTTKGRILSSTGAGKKSMELTKSL
jgi:Ca2+-binding EF-hand superfamily protein